MLSIGNWSGRSGFIYGLYKTVGNGIVYDETYDEKRTVTYT